MILRFFDHTLVIGVGGFSVGAWLTKYNSEIGTAVLILTAIHLLIKIYKELRTTKTRD